ncbi:MAG: sensor histidine kinase, partial [Janthinobacterium lividum]
ELTLLDELRHRGKNDLQLIQAMLVMQKRGQVDAQVRRDFDDVMDRIAAIGVAHDQLTPSRGAGRVQLADYLRALCGNLATRRGNVGIETHLVSMDIPHERAVPLGLIVNELVTNALKYAFPDDQAGTIQVGFELLVQGEAVLYVRDDGIGMGLPRPGSSGTGLVRRLVQQLGGQLDREEVQRGTGFAITFPIVT